MDLKEILEILLTITVFGSIVMRIIMFFSKEENLKYPGNYEYIPIPDILADWDIGSYETSSDAAILAIVPVGENIANSPKTVAIAYQHEKVSSPGREASETMLSMLPDGVSVRGAIIEANDDSVLYEYINFIDPGTGNPTQSLIIPEDSSLSLDTESIESMYMHLYENKDASMTDNQYVISRIIQGKEGLHTIIYSEVTDKVEPGVREQWIKTLANIKISKDSPELNKDRYELSKNSPELGDKWTQ